MTINRFAEKRAGAVLSAENAGHLKKAVAHLKSVLGNAGVDAEGDDDKAEADDATSSGLTATYSAPRAVPRDAPPIGTPATKRALRDGVERR